MLSFGEKIKKDLDRCFENPLKFDQITARHKTPLRATVFLERGESERGEIQCRTRSTSSSRRRMRVRRRPTRSRRVQSGRTGTSSSRAGLARYLDFDTFDVVRFVMQFLRLFFDLTVLLARDSVTLTFFYCFKIHVMECPGFFLIEMLFIERGSITLKSDIMVQKH